MGLTINNNVSALNAHNQLLKTDTALGKSLQKLSSGFSINTASDKPAGLVISEQLRAQIGGMEQAIANSQRASNIIGTAEGALAESTTLLQSIRNLAVEAASSGGMDAEQISANQAEVDSAISTIDRIANSTRFANKRLLDGSQSFKEGAATGTTIDSYTVRGAQFGSASTIDITIDVTTVATKGGTGNLADVGAGGDVILRISGNKGSEIFSFAASTTAADQATAINALSENTGVTINTNNSNAIESVDYGSEAFVSIEVLEGTHASAQSMSRGTDTEGSINGAKIDGSGLYASASSTFFNGTIKMSTAAGTGTATINLQESGMKFQLGADTNPNEQKIIGIDNMHSTNLGSKYYGTTTESGYLSSLRSGQSHSLANNADAAVAIVDDALSDVSRVRAELGAFQKNTLESNINNLRVTTENLTASESRIRDVDFAAEMMEYTKNQILMQSGTSMMAQANVSSQIVFGLL